VGRAVESGVVDRDAQRASPRQLDEEDEGRGAPGIPLGLRHVVDREGGRRQEARASRPRTAVFVSGSVGRDTVAVRGYGPACCSVSSTWVQGVCLWLPMRAPSAKKRVCPPAGRPGPVRDTRAVKLMGWKAWLWKKASPVTTLPAAAGNAWLSE